MGLAHRGPLRLPNHIAVFFSSTTLPHSHYVGRSARRSCPTSLGFSRFKSSSCFADQELYFHCHLLKAFLHAEPFPGAEQILSLWKTSRGPRPRREPRRVTCVYLLPLGLAARPDAHPGSCSLPRSSQILFRKSHNPSFNLP